MTRPELEGVLETVLYYGPDDEERVETFYRDVLGMRPIGRLPGRQLFFRAGESVFLLFNREATERSTSPPPAGATGSVHTCFVVAADAYEPWKEHLRASGVEIIDEINWPRGGVSFYFRDPVGNLLEIADRDIWPGGMGGGASASDRAPHLEDA